jgi:hypothetical protein
VLPVTITIVLFFIAPICVAWGVGFMSVELLALTTGKKKIQAAIDSNTFFMSIGHKYKGIIKTGSKTDWQMMHTY